jgi:hypothetical protein
MTKKLTDAKNFKEKRNMVEMMKEREFFKNFSDILDHHCEESLALGKVKSDHSSMSTV